MPNILDGMVDACYIINMEKDPDKYLKTRQSLQQRFSGEIRRTPAIDGDQLNLDACRQVVNQHYLPHLHPRVIGCAWSHLNTWKHFYQSQLESCFILEDDVIWSKKIKIEAVQELKDLKSRADIIYLGSFGLNRSPDEYKLDDQLIHLARRFNQIQPKPIQLTSPHWIDPEFPTGLYGYILTRPGCQKLLSIFQQDGIINHVDIQLNYYRDQLVFVAAKDPWLSNNYQDSTLASKSPALLNQITQNITFSDGSPFWWRMSHDVYGYQCWFFILGLGILLVGWPFYLLSLYFYLGKSKGSTPNWFNIFYFFTSTLLIREIILYLWVR
jgi:GR25 family glycosyltransferase involved in LPS biosynthesis